MVRFPKGFILKKNRILVLLFLLGIIGFSLRFYKLEAESFWYDEAWSVTLAKASLFEVLQEKIYPLFYQILLHFWVAIFGTGESAARFFSLIFGTASVFLIFFVTKSLFSSRIALGASLLSAISLIQIKYSQEARGYSLLTFLTLLSIFLFLRLLRSPSLKNKVFYVLFNFFLLSTHIYGFFVLIFQTIYLFLFRKEERIEGFLSLQIAVFVLFLPLVPALVKVALEVGKGFWIERPDFLSLVSTLRTFSNGGTISLALFGSLALLGLLLQRRGRECCHPTTFLMLWLFLPILFPFLFSLFFFPVYFIKYVIFTSPAYYILVAKGIDSFQRWWMKVFLFGLLLLLSAFSLRTYYQKTEKEEWREVVSHLQGKVSPLDIILVYEGHRYDDMSLPLKYYLRKEQSSERIARVRNRNELQNILRYRNLKNSFTGRGSLKGEGDIWLILSHTSGTFEWAPIMEELRKRYEKKEERGFVGIKVIHYFKA